MEQDQVLSNGKEVEKDLTKEVVQIIVENVEAGCKEASVSPLDLSLYIKDKVEFLDVEKAQCLFDKSEISEINEQLKQASEAEDYTSNLEPAYLKYIVENQPMLEDVFRYGYNTDKLTTSSISIEKVGERNRIKIVEEPDKRIKEKIEKQITGIASELVNQKGLSKIWALEDVRRAEGDANTTEEKVFNDKLKEPADIYFKSERKFNPNDFIKSFTMDVCPWCKGRKLLKLLFFKIKCPRCKGTGSITVSLANYYDKINKNNPVPVKRVRTLVFEDCPRIINF